MWQTCADSLVGCLYKNWTLADLTSYLSVVILAQLSTLPVPATTLYKPWSVHRVVWPRGVVIVQRKSPEQRSVCSPQSPRVFHRFSNALECSSGTLLLTLLHRDK
jgi:hypothetical protein